MPCNEPTLYQRVKRCLKFMAPTTHTAIACELDVDPEATRQALDDMKRRGLAIDRADENGKMLWHSRAKSAV